MKYQIKQIAEDYEAKLEDLKSEFENDEMIRMILQKHDWLLVL